VPDIRFSLLALLALPAALAQPEVTSWNILRDGFHEKFVDTRRQAVTAVGSIGETPDAVKFLSDALKDDDLEIRQSAAAVMGLYKCRACIPALKVALDDESGEVSFAAAKALWDMGDRSGRAILEEVLSGEVKSAPGAIEGARRSARTTLHDKKAIALMGAKEAAGALLGPASLGITAAEMALKDGNGGGRTLSATMLGEDCDAHILEVLEGELDNEKNWAVRAAVARAIGRCGNADAIPRLEQKLSDSKNLVRFMAAAAIIRLTQKPPVTHASRSAEGPATGARR
jgi:HEAT repeat protein